MRINTNQLLGLVLLILTMSIPRADADELREVVLPRQQSFLRAVYESPDRRWIAALYHPGVVWIWDTREGTIVAIDERRSATAMCFVKGAATTTIAVAFEVQSGYPLEFWSLRPLKRILTLPQSSLVYALDVSADGALLATGHIDLVAGEPKGQIVVSEVESRKVVGVGAVGRFRQVVFSPDGTKVAISHEEPHSPSLWQVAPWKEETLQSLGGETFIVGYNERLADFVVIVTRGQPDFRLATIHGRQLAKLENEEFVRGDATPDGLLVLGSMSGEVRIVDPRKQEVLARRSFGKERERLKEVAFGAKHTHIIIALENVDRSRLVRWKWREE